jgi:hypothetical protein
MAHKITAKVPLNGRTLKPLSKFAASHFAQPSAAKLRAPRRNARAKAVRS